MNDSIVPSSIFLELPDGKYKQMTLFKVDEFKNKFDRFGNVTLRHYTICRKYYVFIFDYRMETEFGIMPPNKEPPNKEPPLGIGSGTPPSRPGIGSLNL